MYETKLGWNVECRMNKRVDILEGLSWDDKNRLKFIGKTNRLKISVLNAYFYYFGQFRVFL